jgi:ribonucleoside-diphosphate reductase alpha subunit
MEQTQVLTRSNKLEPVSFDKITARLREICSWKLDCYSKNNILTSEWSKPIVSIDPIEISKKICSRIYHGIKTTELDAMAAELCASMSTIHPDYGKLASRIVVSNNQKITPSRLSDVIKLGNTNTDALGNKSPLHHKGIGEFITRWSSVLDSMINYDRDYDIDFFGFKTLHRSYLFKVDGNVIERPQHLWMRVAVCLHAPYDEEWYKSHYNEDTDSTEETSLSNMEPYFGRIQETYDALSCKKFIHATPTLFHAGTPRPQCSSCFLMGTEDSVEGIFKTISDAAMISKWAGGIGIHMSNIRANGSYIRKTAGRSLGIMPMLKVYNDTARYINQSGRRNGSFAMYIEPWHADLFDFLEAKKNQGADEARARDLFYALWIPDLFMERVRDDADWYLMCPDESPGLADCYGNDFKQLYNQYETKGIYRKKIKARDVWKAIINSQIETGTPYMLYKDAANECSNQQNVGIIKSSNLCSEIIEYSDSKEYAVCNLASVNLTHFVNMSKESQNRLESMRNNSNVIWTVDNCDWCKMLKGLFVHHSIDYEEKKLSRNENGDIVWPEDFIQRGLNTVPQVFSNVENEPESVHLGGYDKIWEMLCPTFDYEGLHDNVKIITRNLNKIIDINFYPVEETRVSNMRHRPIGIGVQGLADVFMMMRLSFDSQEARKVNAWIHETMYHAALEASCELAKQEGPYETFDGSPLSEGIFQFNLWSLRNQQRTINPMETWDWEILRDSIMKHGVRNSLLIAPMPTASTSQILGNNECFEPYTANMYTRRVLAGEFTVINKHLIRDLQNCKLWNEEMRQMLIQSRGSVLSLPIPKFFKNLYKTAFELKQKVLVDMARDRGFYICQSQSLNLFFERPDFETLSKAHLYSWKCGLKTGSYYIRSKPAITSQQFTVTPVTKQISSVKQTDDSNEPCELCSA